MRLVPPCPAVGAAYTGTHSVISNWLVEEYDNGFRF